MQPPPLPTPSGTPGSHIAAALLSLLSAVGGGGLIAAWLKWSASRSSKPAELQTALNDAFSTLTGELQEERAVLTVRASELEQKLAQRDLTILEKDGEIRGLKQSRDSLIALLKRSGLEVPGE